MQIHTFLSAGGPIEAKFWDIGTLGRQTIAPVGTDYIYVLSDNMI